MVRSRLQEQGHHSEKRYSGVTDCVRKVYQQDGISGFYRGCATNLLRTTPAAVITFTSFEMIHRFLFKIFNPDTQTNTLWWSFAYSSAFDGLLWIYKLQGYKPTTTLFSLDSLVTWKLGLPQHRAHSFTEFNGRIVQWKQQLKWWWWKYLSVLFKCQLVQFAKATKYNFSMQSIGNWVLLQLYFVFYASFLCTETLWSFIRTRVILTCASLPTFNFHHYLQLSNLKVTERR